MEENSKIMASGEKKKGRVIVAIDTGFDGGKVCVNKHVLNIPFMIQDITETKDKFQLRRNDQEFIRCVKDGRTYLLGAVAKTFIMDEGRRAERQSELESFYTLERYNMSLFETALDAFIAYALYRYEDISKNSSNPFKLSEIGEWVIDVAVALPHGYLDVYGPIVRDYLKKPQELELLIGDISTGVITYEIGSKYINSQIICALINQSSDEFGNDIDGSPYDYLPALIVDGGYKTVGLFGFARDQSITNDKSDTDFAMMNINDQLAASISAQTGKQYTGYLVELLAKNGEPINYIDPETNKVVSIDVRAEKEKVIAQMAEKFIKMLNSDYGDLLDTRYILMAGGTGEAYYPFIKEYCEKNRPYIKVVLAGEDMKMGEDNIGPVNAIVCGLFKGVIINEAA